MIRQLLTALLAALAFNTFAAVDANQASRADLETVKGIGPGLSGKIVEARKTGQFKDWNDLVDRVGGVGPGNASRFSQAGLTVGGSAFDAQSMAAPATPAKAAKTAGTAPADKAEKAPKARKTGASGDKPAGS